MQENVLLMKNINTKVKTAQKTLVENIRVIKVGPMGFGMERKNNNLTSAQILPMKLIAKEMSSSFVRIQSPVLIWPRFAMELSIAFLVKMKPGTCAIVNSHLRRQQPENVIKATVELMIFSSKPLLAVESAEMKIVIQIGRF